MTTNDTHQQPTGTESHVGRIGQVNFNATSSIGPTVSSIEALLAGVVESSDDAIITKTLDGVILSWNGGAERMYGYTAEEAVGRSIRMLLPDDREDEVDPLLERIKGGERVSHFETVRVRKDGTRIDVSLTWSPVVDRSGNILAVSIIGRDITEIKKQQATLAENERRLFQILEVIPVGIFVLDSSGEPYYANQQAQYLLGKGIDPQFSTGKLAEIYQAFLTGTDQPYPADRMPVVRALSGETTTVDDMEIHKPDGVTPLQVSAAPIYDGDGRIVYAVAAFSDISDRRRNEAALTALAGTDELTGLYNRRQIMQLLKLEIERCQDYNSFVSLIMLDVDHFKTVNDVYGHPVGDEVLKQIAEIVRSHVRLVDRVGRYGGEELIVILPETTDSGGYVVAERLRTAIAEHSFALKERDNGRLPLQVTVSMGVACFPADASSIDALVSAADKALYKAKEQGRNRTVLVGTSALRTRHLEEA